jgi:hypothetical protein
MNLPLSEALARSCGSFLWIAVIGAPNVVAASRPGAASNMLTVLGPVDMVATGLSAEQSGLDRV